jgi:hypothetical protein
VLNLTGEIIMMFFGAFTLLVLPLFLLVCINMLKQSEFGKTIAGKILEVIFYLMAIAGFATALYLITQI